MKWILCDYGGVIADDHISQQEVLIADLFKCDRKTLRAAVTERSQQGRAVRLDLVSEREFWESVAECITGVRSLPADAEALTSLWSKTYAIRPAVADLLVACAAQGIRAGIATNVDRYREKHMREAARAIPCELPIFASWRFGCMKPNQAYFEAVTKEIGLLQSKASIFFFDDQQVHVDAANDAGWTAYRYTTSEDMRASIFGFLTNPSTLAG